MKALLFLAIAILVCALPGRAVDDLPKEQPKPVLIAFPELKAVEKADDERVAAMQSADKSRLEELFSDDLHYAHSNAVVDTKQALINTLAAGRTKYVGFQYQERKFTQPAPSIVLMTGRAHIQAQTAAGTMDSVLSFLGVWRLENGKWRFLAWQSCKVPPPVAN